MELAVSEAEGLGEPNEKDWGRRDSSQRADTTPATLNALSSKLPLPAFSLPPSLLGAGGGRGATSSQNGLLDAGDFGSNSLLLSLNFGRRVPLINGIVKLPG